MNPSKSAQNVWTTEGGQDFLQLRSSNGSFLAWIDSTGTGQGALSGGLSTQNFQNGEIVSFVGTAGTLLYVPNGIFFQLFKNGQLILNSGDYTLAGANITLIVSAQLSDQFAAFYTH